MYLCLLLFASSPTKSEEFGVSNFSAAQLESLLAIATKRCFVPVTVYQCPYNVIDRGVETAVLPILRAHGIRLAAHSPLAGGYLTERFVPDPTAAATDAAKKESDGALSKFAADSQGAWFYKGRYLPAAAAVAALRDVAHAHGLTLTEVALRWLQWHSQLQPGDHGIVVGANKIEHLQTTLANR